MEGSLSMVGVAVGWASDRIGADAARRTQVRLAIDLGAPTDAASWPPNEVEVNG